MHLVHLLYLYTVFKYIPQHVFNHCIKIHSSTCIQSLYLNIFVVYLNTFLNTFLHTSISINNRNSVV